MNKTHFRYFLRLELLNFQKIFPKSKLIYNHIDGNKYPNLKLLDENGNTVAMINTFEVDKIEYNSLYFSKHYTEYSFLNIDDY